MYDVKDFQNEVIEKSKEIPVLVDFWAEWCGPCRILGPVLEKLEEKYKDNWVLAKLNTEENREVAAKYGIRSIPNVKLFIDGEVKDEFTGALPENMIEQWLKKAIPGKHAGSVKEAKKLIENGEVEKAKVILEEVLTEEPSYEEARINLSRIIIFNDKDRAKKLIEDIDGSPDNYELAEAISTFADLFYKLESANKLPYDDIKEMYLNAIADLKNKDFETALKKFIEVIRNKKSYDDEGARKACIAIFKYLGEEDATTIKHRKDFGSALYV